MKRGLRRHHATRLKRNRANYWSSNSSSSKRNRGMVINTPKPCSCWMCGNARKHHGKTLQEQKFYISCATG